MLTKILDVVEHTARQIMIEGHMNLPPTWIIVPEKGEPIFHVTPWRNQSEKLMAELMIRLELQEHKAGAYGFVSEAWAAVAPPDWDPDKTPLPKAEQPRERVDRQEIVIACATDGETTKCRRWLTKRNWKGQVERLEPLPTDDEEYTGWMATLLNE